ncbi:S-adenosyl-L-methionine-dependent methyltransferase [Boletus edulis BED1]|uniref:Histone-lysine N-methyltransferase, H3 lysine-79 specific n=1 Tax=Boletus edulis BED1 TaxID=1328754 RepID=A0AAD4BTJ7_BOLED|nr:S-adenosyl-L-methionine-dependent methyltransferase [Boletus edulis BED1]
MAAALQGVCVTTRRGWKLQLQELEAPPPTPDTSYPPTSSPDSSPLTDSSGFDFPSPSRETSVSASSSSKRQRAPSLAQDAPRVVTRPRKIKKRASTSPYTSGSSSRGESRQRSVALELDEPIYRSDRSRSTSVFPPPVHVLAREWWSLDGGSPGDGFVSAADVVRKLARSYKPYFRNPDDPDNKSFEVESFPTADLEYPNNDANEKFMLLVPKDKDHYNPIMCLEQSLYTIIDSYLSPAQKALFGSLPSKSIPDNTPPPSPSLSPITRPDPPDPSSVLDTPPEPQNLPPQPQNDPPQPDYIRSLQRAIRRRDGPLFLSTLESINQLLRSLKYPPLPSDVFLPAPPNVFTSAVRSWTRGLPDKVVLRIVDETYQRCVGPNIKNLHRYEAFSSEVYGELMPSFTSDIIAATGLNSSSLLMDLGSGVGNVLLQASLQTGCRSYGIELLEGPANVARQQWKQFQKRCQMWGVCTGNVELEEGDMLKSKRVTELMGKADVVLVNNKVFQQSLNEALRAKFLDLKEGAIVVSLKPFVSPNARVTERNVDDICAIFDVVERPYRSGSVSWGSGGGTYYLHRVDRAGYANVKQRFENSRARTARRR